MNGAVPKPPKGLSKWARQLWRALLEEHEFQLHELVVLERALKWWDAADTAQTAAAGATGTEQAQLRKLSLDASTAALRHWRALKFPAVEGARRPGRPSAAEWSAQRRAAAAR